MKNYSELIKNKTERTLTAKGNAFLWRCIDIVADKNGISRYDTRMKEIKQKLSIAIKFLIIDKNLSINEIKEIIQKSKNNALQIN